MPIGCINTPFKSMWSDPMNNPLTGLPELMGELVSRAPAPADKNVAGKTGMYAARPRARAPATGRLLEQLSSAKRKEYPMAEGLLDYFPDALAEVSHVSWLGNQKHNPGQPLGWSRDKSADHADCVVRHMTTRGSIEDNGIMHLAEAAWRVLAELQIALEKQHNLAPPPAAK